MVKKEIYFFGILASIILILVSQVSAIDTAREERLKFGYVLVLKNITTDPADLIPGKPGVLKMLIENKAEFPLYDIRIQLSLPSQIKLLEDITKRKVFKMEPGEIKEIVYEVIPTPKDSEGIYDGSVSITYLNHVATEREESDNFSIIVRSKPKIFAEIDSSGIYEGNLIGDVSINFINNEVANVKFLTVELLESPDYQIISSNKKYIGDLDSNDFQSADFKLKVNDKVKETTLIVKATYKDFINNDYSENFNLKLFIKNPKELGIQGKMNWWIVLIVIIVLIAIIYIYRRLRKKKR